MSKFISALFAAALFSTAFSVMAAEPNGETQDLGVADPDSMIKNFHKSNMQMDANHDGMISKKEYMNHQEMMYNNMNKNKDGLVTMHDMDSMYAGTTKGNKLRPSGKDPVAESPNPQ